VDDINEQVAERLRRLRRNFGMSLEDLAQKSGVSRAMLSQIETLKTNPTIAVLWKISHGLGVSFAELLGTDSAPAVTLSRVADARYLYSADRKFSSRPMLANVPGHKVELYQLQLAPGAIEEAEAHPSGTYEQIVVTSGKLVLGLGAERHALGPGDALLFRADVPHRYECAGARAFVGLSLILYGS
jgi:XRE family transcriptional regulator, regulator of sulfur utilization